MITNEVPAKELFVLFGLIAIVFCMSCNLFLVAGKPGTANRMAVEVHYYGPFQFCGLTSDAAGLAIRRHWMRCYRERNKMIKLLM